MVVWGICASIGKPMRICSSAPENMFIGPKIFSPAIKALSGSVPVLDNSALQITLQGSNLLLFGIENVPSKQLLGRACGVTSNEGS